MNYANLVWGNTCKTKLKRINSKIKQASRIICNKDKLEHSKPLLKSLDILDVYQLNIYRHLKFMFEVKIEKTPQVHIKGSKRLSYQL